MAQTKYYRYVVQETHNLAVEKEKYFKIIYLPSFPCLLLKKTLNYGYGFDIMLSVFDLCHF